jgi:hypothetical protein
MKIKENRAGERSRAKETINPDEHCRRLERAVEED